MKARAPGLRHRRMGSLFTAAIVACALAPAAVMATTSLPPNGERNAPLIMENADRFEGYRSRGEYVLSGKVRFRHGQMLMETERAVWMKDRNIVSCESGMRITRNGSLLTADRGTYDKSMGQAAAQGNVFIRDSSGENVATGSSVVYLRFRHLATLTGNPEVRRFYVKKDSTAADTAGRDSASAKSGDSGPDTLSIKGDVMTYDDSLQVAVADGNVRITRDKLKITCKKAEYHDASDSLYLLGEPHVVADGNQVKGDIMRLGMHGEEIKSLLVKGSAQAHSTEPATDTSAARQSDVNGDSLFLAFKKKAIDSVQVFKNATGAYFDVDKPAFVNKMTGDYMVLRFNGKQVASANVMGGGSTSAKSTYYHFEKKKLKGKNDAEGDTIDFAFKDGKVDEVMVKGSAKGTYFGEKNKGRNGAQPDSAMQEGPKPMPTQNAPASAPKAPAFAPAEKNATGGDADDKQPRKPIRRNK